MRHTLVGAIVLLAGPAVASPVVVTVEGGAEYDSNLQRVETGPGLETAPIAGEVVRVGGKLDKRDKLLDGTYAATASILTRAVSQATADTENVALFGAELRYLRPLAARNVSVGMGVAGADSIGISEDIGARTFTSIAADALLVLEANDTTHLSFAVGARRFTYKENHDFDWAGPAATARLDTTLWAPSGGTRTLELAVTAGFELRGYDAIALANVCAPGTPLDQMCSAATRLDRTDRVERIGAELTYTGRVIATVGYQLTVIDSNSFGQSLIRHKATASATTTLVEGFYATALAQLQIDKYTDGLVLETDTQRSEFTSLDDENRSSLQVRVGHPLTDAWSAELRGAIWRNIGGDMNSSFSRSSVYAGLIYNH
ncbi:MAG TPA: hypothetical protein VGM90_03835 [Kofleriaceae bacterium]|jgi:hypothetical protein